MESYNFQSGPLSFPPVRGECEKFHARETEDNRLLAKVCKILAKFAGCKIFGKCEHNTIHSLVTFHLILFRKKKLCFSEQKVKKFCSHCSVSFSSAAEKAI